MINSFRGKYAFLSNFYPSRIDIIGNGEVLSFPTLEHAYQAAKNEDPEYQIKMSLIGTPKEAKELGGTVKLRENWNNARLGIMFALVTMKFSQNPDLAKKLIETGDEYLEEGNNHGDTFWGTVDGKGRNHLGHILMIVRSIISCGSTDFFA